MTAEIVVDLHGYSGLGAEFVRADITATGLRVTIRGALAEALSARTAQLEAALREIADFSATEHDDDPLSHVHGTAIKALEQ